MGLDTVELVMGFEREFDIEISNEAAERILSARDVRDLVLSEYLRLGRTIDPDKAFGRIARVTGECLGVPAEGITLDTEFVRDLGAN
jgi:acyl carrier protein